MENDREKFKIEFKKRIYTFVLNLIKFLHTLPQDTITETLIKQLVRSGTSIIANYIEAQSASSKRDFTNFFHYALKSTNESKVWLALIRDTTQINNKDRINLLLEELNEVSKILASSILTLKGKNRKCLQMKNEN